MKPESVMERMRDLSDYLNISLAELEDEDFNNEEQRQYEIILIRGNAAEMVELAEELLKNTGKKEGQSMNSYTFKSGDDIPNDEKFISVEIENGGIAIQHEGTGCLCGEDAPIFIEWYDGKPRIIIWADINEEEPTHVIDMSGALESNRKE